jgi:hypothetical protein
MHFAVVILKSFFFTMDLDSDYYSSRCKDVDGLVVFKGTFMTCLLWVETIIIKRYSILKQKEFFTVSGGDALSTYQLDDVIFIAILGFHGPHKCRYKCR